MPAKNPRLNLTIGPDQLGLISRLARKRKTSLSETALSLISDALEMQEDLYFSELGEEILGSNKKWYAHEEAWNLKGKENSKARR